jgi:hypothetical protein
VNWCWFYRLVGVAYFSARVRTNWEFVKLTRIFFVVRLPIIANTDPGGVVARSLENGGKGVEDGGLTNRQGVDRRQDAKNRGVARTTRSIEVHAVNASLLGGQIQFNTLIT